MNLFRQLNYRRFVITLLLLAGLLPQMRTVFACEFIDGVVQLSCCCDEPGEINCDNYTKNNGDCDNHSSALATSSLENKCCDVSYQAVSTSINTNTVGIQTADARIQNLDAPQPPPGAVFNHFLADSTSITGNAAYTIISDIQSAKAGKSTYLHTLRLRI